MTIARLIGTVSVEADDPAAPIKVPGWHLETAELSPGAASETGTGWTNEANITASDDSKASYSGTEQEWLIASTFTLTSLPRGARVLGVEVTIEGNGASATGTERDIDVALYADGAILGSAETVRLDQTTDADVIAGGPFDTFGVARLMTNTLIDGSFQVRIRKNTALDAALNIDHVTVIVHYTTVARVLDGSNVPVKYTIATVDATTTSLTAVGATSASAYQCAENARQDDPDAYPWPSDPKAMFAASTSTVLVTCKEQVPG